VLPVELSGIANPILSCNRLRSASENNLTSLTRSHAMSSPPHHIEPWWPGMKSLGTCDRTLLQQGDHSDAGSSHDVSRSPFYRITCNKKLASHRALRQRHSCLLFC